MKELKNLLGKTQMNNILSRAEAEKIRKGINTISNCYKRRKKLNIYECSLKDIEIKNIKEALNCLLTVITREPITVPLRDLTKKIVKFISDWNKKFVKDSEIEGLCLTTKRFLECYFSVIESIQIIKELLKRINKVQKFSPPAFELSQNYLRSLGKKSARFSGGEIKNKNKKSE